MKQVSGVCTVATAFRKDLDLLIRREGQINVCLKSEVQAIEESAKQVRREKNIYSYLSPSYFVSTATLPDRCFVALAHVPGLSDLGTYTSRESA